MLVQVCGYEKDLYRGHFDKMFHHRKIIFRDEKKWDVNVVDGCYEIDEYDRDDTVYLMSIDDRGELVGSVRLISTIMPHMLEGPFRPMFPELAFKSPTIWEATRFAVIGDRSVQPNQVSTAACEIMLGVVEFGLENGMRQVTGVYDACVLRLYRRCGFYAYRELGRHRSAEHGMIHAGICGITPDLEDSVRAATGLPGPEARVMASLAA